MLKKKKIRSYSLYTPQADSSQRFQQRLVLSGTDEILMLQQKTLFSPLFYLYWNHKLSYIYISFIEVFYFHGFVSGFNFE